MVAASAVGIRTVNPLIDVGLWAVVIVCCIALWFEIPRAVRETKKILEEHNEER